MVSAVLIMRNSCKNNVAARFVYPDNVHVFGETHPCLGKRFIVLVLRFLNINIEIFRKTYQKQK